MERAVNSAATPDEYLDGTTAPAWVAVTSDTRIDGGAATLGRSSTGLGAGRILCPKDEAGRESARVVPDDRLAEVKDLADALVHEAIAVEPTLDARLDVTALAQAR